MSHDDTGAASTRPYIRYSANLARAICLRVAAGETLGEICADPDLPAASTVTRWAREHDRFAEIYHRAKALARREGLGPTTTYCELTAHEICARLAEGESLTAISDDPAMPAMYTILHWQRRSPAFAEAVALARQAQAERLADRGWEMALAATPETAYLTRVQLGHLRWMAAIKSPRTHGKIRAAAPPDPPPPPPEPILLKHFVVETHPQTGQRRVVTYLPDPALNRPVRVKEGPWTAAIDPIAKLAALSHPAAEPPAGAPPPEGPEDWL